MELNPTHITNFKQLVPISVQKGVEFFVDFLERDRERGHDGEIEEATVTTFLEAYARIKDAWVGRQDSEKKGSANGTEITVEVA